MKIRIGLLAPSTAWTQLCEQEGIPCGTVDVSSSATAEEYSILVVNRALGPKDREAVEQYLRDGGGVIGYTLYLQHVAGVEGTEQDVRYLVAEGDTIFPSVHLLDLGVHGWIPHGANALRTDLHTMAVRAGSLGSGFAVVLPFDVDVVFHDGRAVNKNFYFTLDRLPSERVSMVAKGELRHLVHCAFEYLHHVRGMPYAHLWYFPNNFRNVFAFRIDSDGSSREEMDTLYQIGHDHNVAMTWFLDVKSHETWLDHFRYFVDQEIGLHCYEHQTYPTLEWNLKNITRGLHEMQQVGLQPLGFAAPFGIWNPELGKAIDEVGFQYSSEFSYACDTLPLLPESGGTKFKTLQVPVHPICIGSLMRAGYSDARMREYFTMVAAQKFSRHEPLFFYHHPSHRHWNVVEGIFSLAGEGVEIMTLGAYAEWWKRRIAVRYAADVEGEVVRIHDSGSPFPGDVWLRVTNTRREEVILPAGESIALFSLRWTAPVVPAPPPADIRRIREFDPRKMLGELYDSLVRKLR